MKAAGVRFFKVYLCHATLSRKMYSGLLRVLSTLSCKTDHNFSAGQVYNRFISSLFIKANGYKKEGVFSPTLSRVGENRQLLDLRVSSVNVLLASQFQQL